MTEVRVPVEVPGADESPFFMPYAPIIRAAARGDMLFISGCAALPVFHDHPHDLSVPVPEDIQEQTRLSMRAVEECLAAAGASMADVVRMDYFVTDISAQNAVGAVLGEFLKGDFPTSTMVQVAALVDPRLKIEINAIAVVPQA